MASRPCGFDLFSLYAITEVSRKPKHTLLTLDFKTYICSAWLSPISVRTCHSYFLQFIPLSQGRNLSLDAFDNIGIRCRTFLWLFSLRGFCVGVSSSLWFLSVVSSLFWLFKSCANICWILVRATCWALEVYSWASIRLWRSLSCLLSAMLTNTIPVCSELTVVEEAE